VAVEGSGEPGKQEEARHGGEGWKKRQDLLPHIGIGTDNVIIPEVDWRYCAGSPPVDQVSCEDLYFSYWKSRLACDLDKSESYISVRES